MPRALLFGIAAAPGIAIGTAHFAHAPGRDEERRILPSEVAGEQASLRQAADDVRAAFAAARENVPADLAEYRDVIAAQMEMLRDPRLLDAALARIAHSGLCASWALRLTVEELCDLFRGMDDPYLRDRAQDVRAVGLRLRERLSAAPRTRRPHAGDGVLLAEDLSPADIMELDSGQVRGILTAEGGSSSHTAILARGMRLPCLVGVTGLMNVAREGEAVIVDGLSGCALLGPDETDLAGYAARRDAYADWEAMTARDAHWPAEMCDGVRVAVQANIKSPAEAAPLAEAGADGVGLYRTEFAFFGERPPSEQALLADYAEALRRMAPRPVAFRTLDSGADKLLPAQAALHEPNPALGLRGIRFTLRHQDIFRAQLRALMRAGAAGNAAILLPMVTGVSEVRQTRRILEELHQELAAQRLPHAARPPLGVMIETPAAAAICDALARECDFFSIGTNDLIHYIMAIDRSNRHVAYLNEPLHPAVVRTLKQVVDAARREGIGVSVCGEMASDPFGLALLLGMGVDTVSAAPRFIPGMKHLIRQLSAEDCANLAHSVLLSTDVTASRRMVREALRQSLGRELAFHTSTFFTAREP